MTKLLQQAFDEASKLPDSDQDALAALLLSEIESDRQWDEAFVGSEGLLVDWPKRRSPSTGPA